jgi:hypothetical protein
MQTHLRKCQTGQLRNHPRISGLRGSTPLQAVEGGKRLTISLQLWVFSLLAFSLVLLLGLDDGRPLVLLFAELAFRRDALLEPVQVDDANGADNAGSLDCRGILFVVILGTDETI